MFLFKRNLQQHQEDTSSHKPVIAATSIVKAKLPISRPKKRSKCAAADESNKENRVAKRRTRSKTVQVEDQEVLPVGDEVLPVGEEVLPVAEEDSENWETFEQEEEEEDSLFSEIEHLNIVSPPNMNTIEFEDD